MNYVWLLACYAHAYSNVHELYDLLVYNMIIVSNDVNSKYYSIKIKWFYYWIYISYQNAKQSICIKRYLQCFGNYNFLFLEFSYEHTFILHFHYTSIHWVISKSVLTWMYTHPVNNFKNFTKLSLLLKSIKIFNKMKPW